MTGYRRCRSCGGTRMRANGQECPTCRSEEIVLTTPQPASPPPMVEPSRNGGPPAPEPLRFVSAAELSSLVPERPPWLWEGYLAQGALTLLAGRPKSGKSTLAWAITEAIAARAPTFLGRGIEHGGVVYVSEEGVGTLAHKLPRGERVRVLTRDAAWPKPSWARVIAETVKEAGRVGAVLLVIDSLAFWAAFGEGQENDAGAAQAALNVLGIATTAGLAVLLVHHQRKSGGSAGDAVRGTGAIFGAVDALVELERLDGPAPATGQRRLVGVSRWPSIPPVLVVERDAAGKWRAIREVADRDETAELAVRDRLLSALPSDGLGATEQELANRLGVDGRKIGHPLRASVEAGRVERTGRGRKGDPYRYRRRPEDAPPDSPLAPGEHLAQMLPSLLIGGEHGKENPALSPREERGGRPAMSGEPPV